MGKSKTWAGALRAAHLRGARELFAQQRSTRLAMSKRSFEECAPGEIIPEDRRAKAQRARDCKWDWVNGQAKYKLVADHGRALLMAKEMRRKMGYENPNPTFEEVMQVMERFDNMRRFVWDRLDIDMEFVPDWAGRDDDRRKWSAD